MTHDGSQKSKGSVSTDDRSDLILFAGRKLHRENVGGAHSGGFCKPCADAYFALQNAVHEFFNDRTSPCSERHDGTGAPCEKRGVHVTHKAGTSTWSYGAGL